MSVGIDTPLNNRFSLLSRNEYGHETSTAIIVFHDAEQPQPILDAHIDRFYFFAPLCIGKRVLDVGCGFGYGAKILAQFAAEVVAIDIDPHELDFARTRHAAHNITYIQEKVQALDAGDFDVCVCTEVIEHIDPAEVDAVLHAISARLRPNALLVFTTPCQAYTQKTDNRFHVQEYSYPDFTALIARYFVPKSAFFYDWNTATLSARPSACAVPGRQSHIVQIIIAEHSRSQGSTIAPAG
ncbi:class I SAM-dependent methyltransferase [Megalodesulfovibrio paquesii]